MTAQGAGLRVWHVNLGGPSVTVDGITAAVGAASAQQRSLGCEVSEFSSQRESQGIAAALRELGPVLRGLRDPGRRPDVVHLHSVFRPLHALLAVALAGSHVPWVVSPHSGLSGPGRQRQALRKRLYIRLIERRLIGRAEGVCCLTEQEARDVRAALPATRLPVLAVIPNGVRVAARPPSPAAETADDAPAARPVLLTLARFDTRQKGLDRLSALAACCPEFDFDVYGAPDGNEPRRLQQLLATAPSNLHLRAPVFGADKQAIMASACLYLQPSRWEGLSLALLEAMGGGLACVVSGYIAGTMPFRTQGLGIVLDDDVEAGAAQLRHAVADPGLRRRVGQASAAFVREHYDPVQVARLTVELYADVARGATARSMTVPAPLAPRAAEPPEGAIWLGTVDLDRPLAASVPPPRASEGGSYVGAQLLVRIHGQPIGELRLPLTGAGIDADQLAAHLSAGLSDEINAHLDADGWPPESRRTPRGAEPLVGPAPCTWSSRLGAVNAGSPLASIALATCRRPERLLRTLRTLSAQTYPNFEVIVVDNCPDCPGAAGAVASVGDPRIRLLVEPRPGASHARNAGLREASGDVVAFTDDDIDADPEWLGNLIAPFYEDPGTACVTGLILPVALDTAAERTFEEFGGFSKGLRPQTFSLGDTGRGPLYPYAVGLFGSGACAAFRRVPFTELGGFATDLGPATIARGGEDLDAYLSVLHAGYRLRYAPAAVVRHEHRQDSALLAGQVYSYGIGLSAMITKRILGSRAEGLAVARALPAAVRYLLAPDSPKNAKKTRKYPRSLTASELAGVLYGPVAYLRSRRRQRRASAAR